MADDDDAGLASGAESEDQGPILSLQSLKNQQNVRGKRKEGKKKKGSTPLLQENSNGGAGAGAGGAGAGTGGGGG